MFRVTHAASFAAFFSRFFRPIFFNIAKAQTALRGLFTIGFSLVFLSPVLGQNSQKPVSRPIPNWEERPHILEKRFTQADGLPVNSLTSLELGTDGALYVTSYDGLARFNGYSFSKITFPDLPELSSERFTRIKRIEDHTFLIGTEAGFHFLWRNGQSKTITFPSKVGTKQNPQYAGSAAKGIHFFTDESRVGKLSFLTANRPEIVFELENDSLITFFPETATRWWVTAKSGIHFIEKGKTKFHLYWDDMPLFKYFGPGIKPLAEGSTLLYGTFGVLAVDSIGQIIQKTSFFEQGHGEPVRRVFERTPGNFELFTADQRIIWSLENGVERVQKRSHYIDYGDFDVPEFWLGKRLEPGLNGVLLDGEPLYVPSKPFGVQGILLDSLNQLWVATAGDGLIRFQENLFHSVTKEDGLPGENLYSILPWNDGTLALASMDAGPILLENDAAKWWQKSITGPLTRALGTDRFGTLYSGQYSSSIWRLEADSVWEPAANAADFFASWNNSGESIYEDPKGNFWIGCRENLLFRPSGSETFREIRKPDGNSLALVRAIVLSPDSQLVLLTSGSGVWTIQEDQKLVQLFAGASQINSTRDVFFKSKNEWWFATENRGLVAVRFNQSIKALTVWEINEKQGLPDNSIHRILPDQFGFWWLSSNQGIIRVKESELQEFIKNASRLPKFDVFQEPQGLPSRETNGGTQSAGFVGSDGRIWIPTQKGLVFFNPKDFLLHYAPGKIRLSPIELVTENRTILISANAPSTLKNTERNVVLRFDALNLEATKPLSFEYRTDRFSDWLPLGSASFVSLSSLNAGIQTVEIRLKNGDPVAAPLVVSFTVDPFFYETTLFWGLIAFGVLLLIIGAVFTTQFINKKRQIRLERLIKERTQDLAEQKSITETALKTVQKQAEKLEDLDRYKTDLFLGFAHEFRTPLALIQGPLELLQQATDRVDTENAKVQLDLIKRNSGQLHKLVERLLKLIRISDATEIQPLEALDIDRLFLGMVKNFREQLTMTSKTLSFQIPSPVGIILTEPSSLELILSNLISNAIKYSGDDTRIVVTLERMENAVVFSVQNGGDIIPEEDQVRIYDLFFRGRNTAAKPGSGVGLTVVKRLVEKMGGGITLQSTAENGTVFTVSLPYLSVETSDIETEVQALSPVLKEVYIEEKAPAEHRNQTHSLLIVEDNPDFRTLLRTALEPLYSITFAVNGRKGVKAFADGKFDLIISDVMMPEMSGFEFAESIRSADTGRHIPFVFLTANDRPEAFEKGLSLGADAYLTKPVSMELLKAHIQALLARKTAIEKIETPDSSLEKAEIVNKIDELILLHLGNPELSVDALAHALNMSRATLYRMWEKTGEESINDRIVKTRLKFVLEMVKDKDFTFSQASLACGFADSAYFSRVFKRVYGKSPREYVAE